MSAIIFILVTGTVIAAIETAAVVVVINIQAVDRSKRLVQQPRNVLDAATRRIVGTTTHSSGLRRIKAG